MTFLTRPTVANLPKVWREFAKELDDMADTVRAADNWWSQAFSFAMLVLTLMFLALLGLLALTPVLMLVVWLTA